MGDRIKGLGEVISRQQCFSELLIWNLAHFVIAVLILSKAFCKPMGSPFICMLSNYFKDILIILSIIVSLTKSMMGLLLYIIDTHLSNDVIL